MLNRKSKRAMRGFTLIELLVVVTIIGILAGVAVLQVMHGKIRAQEAALKYDLTTMRKAIDDFYADKQRYPTSLQELVDEHYLRKIPTDPITESPETWQTVTQDPADQAASESENDDSSSTSMGPGIVDVKSGAEGVTHDSKQTPYGEL